LGYPLDFTEPYNPAGYYPAFCADLIANMLEIESKIAEALEYTEDPSEIIL
jgi:hypothetical protein